MWIQRWMLASTGNVKGGCATKLRKIVDPEGQLPPPQSKEQIETIFNLMLWASRQVESQAEDAACGLSDKLRTSLGVKNIFGGKVDLSFQFSITTYTEQ